MVDTVQTTSAAVDTPANLAALEAQVAAAIANEPEPGKSPMGGDILPNSPDRTSDDHDTDVFNKGQELAAQLERAQLNHNKQLQEMSAQHNTQLGAMQNQLQQVTDTLQQVQKNTPTQTELTPQQKYALTPEEIAEMETTLPGVQKVANAAAETSAQAIISQLRQDMANQQSQFTSALEELKAAQTLQGKTSTQQYDTVIMNTGFSLGLDVASLPNDRAFQEFLSQKESPYSDRTLHQVVQEAEQTGNAKVTAQLLRTYAMSLAEKTGLTGAPQLTGTPAGGGGLGGMLPGQTQGPQEESPITRMENQRASIHAQRQQLNAEMTARRMDPDDFRTQISQLDKLDRQLIDALVSQQAQA